MRGRPTHGQPAEPTHGQAAEPHGPLAEVRWIEIDLSDLGLPADLSTADALATAAACVYERFVPFADEGWEWLQYPGSRAFDGWTTADDGQRRRLAGARLLSRRAAPAPAAIDVRPAHGLSAYRTRQLVGRPWTAEPGSKRWKPFV